MNATEPKINYPVEYRGYKIYSVFNYLSGRSDFEVFHQCNEYGRMYASMTLGELMEQIDDEVEEREHNN